MKMIHRGPSTEGLLNYSFEKTMDIIQENPYSNSFIEGIAIEDLSMESEFEATRLEYEGYL